jgi:hypothetical protein
MVKGAEFRRRTTEGPDNPEVWGDAIDDETKPSLLGELEAILGFTLDLRERISRGEKVRVQGGAAVRRNYEVAGLIRGLERPAHQITAGPDMFRPWYDELSEPQIGPGLEALQAAFFDQFITEPAEAKSGLVVAEVWAGYHAKVYIGDARTVAVAMLEAEINRPTDRQGEKIRIRKRCRRQNLGQNVHGREGRRVTHQGQLNELLDFAAFEFFSDPLVFAARFLF